MGSSDACADNPPQPNIHLHTPIPADTDPDSCAYLDADTKRSPPSQHTSAHADSYA